MNTEKMRRLLESVEAGEISSRQALRQLRTLPFQDLGFARVDHHRELRTGFPEVIFCQGKTAQQVTRIAASMVRVGSAVLCTRCSSGQIASLKRKYPRCRVYEDARTVVLGRKPGRHGGKVAVVCAGRSDIPVAEEARVTAELGGAEIVKVYDAGVAGLHRILAEHGEIAKCDAVVVVAGMEGALASVVGGLVPVPVIACPTSIGYGASFGGIAALLAMLNSCAPGVSVVNIDNGFGAGYIAGMIARGMGRSRMKERK